MSMDEYTPEDSPSAQQAAGMAPAFETVEPEQAETVETVETVQGKPTPGESIALAFDLDEGYRKYRRSQPPEPLERLKANIVSVRAVSRSIDDWIYRHFPDEGYGIDMHWAVDEDPDLELLLLFAQRKSPDTPNTAGLLRSVPDKSSEMSLAGRDPRFTLLIKYFEACHDTSRSGRKSKVWMSTHEVLEKYLEWCGVEGLEDQNSVTSIQAMGNRMRGLINQGYIDPKVHLKRRYDIESGPKEMRTGRMTVPYVGVNKGYGAVQKSVEELDLSPKLPAMVDQPCQERQERSEVVLWEHTLTWHETLRWHILECYLLDDGDVPKWQRDQMEESGIWTPVRIIHNRYLKWCRMADVPALIHSQRRMGKALSDIPRVRPSSRGDGKGSLAYVPEGVGKFVNGERRRWGGALGVRTSGWFVPPYKYSE